jgi:hypothetical protein
LKLAKLKNMGGTKVLFQTNDALVRKAGATLLLITRASKLSPLKRVRLIRMLLHDGTGVVVGVRVCVGVSVGVGDNEGVGVSVVVGDSVREGVKLGVKVGEGVKVGVGV